MGALARALALGAVVVGALAQPAAAVPQWPGRFTFEEFAPPNQTWGYVLTIDRGGTTGRLQVDGFQTHLDMDLKVAASPQQEAIVTLLKHRDPPMPAIYKPGERLFTLAHGPHGMVVTRWGAMQPNIPVRKQLPGFKRYFPK